MAIIGSGITIGSGISFEAAPFLYPFTNFTFTNGNIIGSTSGNTTRFLANYSNVGNTWITSSSYYRVTTPGYQVWTVPESAIYEIEVAGSRSSLNTYANNTFGNGAIVRGRFSLTQGSNLTIAVGSFSGNTINNSAYSGAGGGGGTFVIVTATGNPLIIGAGGGGSGRWQGWESGNIKLGSNGSTNTYGTSSRQQPYGNAAPGGTLGQGGNSHVAANGTVSSNSFDSGGGGGFYSNGVNGVGGNVRTNATNGSSGGGGQGFQANLIGGVFSSSYSGQASSGGFGGGGGGTAITGGGGGGYSGGGGAYAPAATAADGGGGGGSYIDATATAVATSDGFYNSAGTFGGASITNIGTFNGNAGYVKITKL
jgi:hypothetical protein